MTSAVQETAQMAEALKAAAHMGSALGQSPVLASQQGRAQRDIRGPAIPKERGTPCIEKDIHRPQERTRVRRR